MTKLICAATISLFAMAASDPQVQHDDYPALALRMSHEGEVRFHADYGPEGYVTDCTITKSSGFAELDAQTCILVRRWSHSQPQSVRTKDGSIKWKLPKT